VGALVGGWLVDWVSLPLLPAVSGVLILIVTWLPGGLPLVRGRVALVGLGFYQTGLGMLAGATGPLGAAVMTHLGKGRDWLVVNTGVYMTVNHFVRSSAYALIGFAFAPWWELIAAMALATLVGAKLGQRLRRFVPERNFAQVFRWLITLLALRMIALSIDGVGL
jgi:uncharacterized membrane protein YfcA